MARLRLQRAAFIHTRRAAFEKDIGCREFQMCDLEIGNSSFIAPGRP
jgi:hypothetical protein